MSANRKVILIILLGVGASLFSFFSSQYFSEKTQNNQLFLSQIEQLSGRVENIRLLSKDFIQNGNEDNWQKILENLSFLRLNLGTASGQTSRWQEASAQLKSSLEQYRTILDQIHDPAVRLRDEKIRLQSIGLSFSKIVDERIIKPYRQDEGLRIYRGEPIDPFKTRIKETAYDLIAQHNQQQLILLELLLDWNVSDYLEEKRGIETALARHQSQLRYITLLMGEQPEISDIVSSIEEKINRLSKHERVLLDLFTSLSSLNTALTETGDALLYDKEVLSAQIVTDIGKANRLNRILSWTVLSLILLALGLLGSMLASDIIRFVGELNTTHAELEEKIIELEENINARAQAENALRVSEEKYRSIFENAPEGLFQSTEDGRLLSANPALAEIFGYDSPEEMLSTITDIAHQLYLEPEDRERLHEQLLNQEAVNRFEALFRTKTGETITCSLNARYVCDQATGAHHIEGIFQDITARKQAEKDKAALEEQLRQSQKMEAIGSLAGGISHDFNNILQAISGNLQLLLMKKTEQDPDKKRLLEIEKAVKRASDITKRLLTFSRKLESKREIVWLNEVIGSALALMKHTLPKMISLETRLASDLPAIIADSTQLDQVLINLAANAADAMPEGGRLLIETEKIILDHDYQMRHLDIRQGVYALLTITDTGVGIERETLQHIYEPFYTTKEVGRGTGLGLSIVYGIIKSLKGSIYCYSEIGVGTTFKIYLPATEVEGIAQDVTPAIKNLEIAEGSETILIVDDEKMIRDIAQEILCTYGYKTLTAESGEEALTLFEKSEERIDLVILDLGMPGMGGEKCLQSLLNIQPSLRVIVSSGYAAHKLAKDPEGHGAAGFIGKPYQLQEMLVAIRTVLDSDPGTAG